MSKLIAIFVVGPSSTGKTTLCQALGNRLTNMEYPVVRISEVARTVMLEQGFTRENVGTLAMQEAILLAQVRSERQKIEQIRSQHEGRDEEIVLLSDRSAIDPYVYAVKTLPKEEYEQIEMNSGFREAMERYSNSSVDYGSSKRMKSVVILTNPVPEWIFDDGVRSLEDPWVYGRIFRETLKRFGIDYVEMGEEIKNLDDRVEMILSLIGLGS